MEQGEQLQGDGGIWWSALAMQPDGGGVHVYCAELLGALAVVLADGSVDGLGELQPLRARVRSDATRFLPAEVEAVTAGDRAGARRTMAALARVKGAPAIVHGLDAELPLGVGGAKTVVTVHDLSVYESSARSTRALAKRRTVSRSIRSADRVIVNSAATASAVAERFGVESVVTPLAPRTAVRAGDAAQQEALLTRFGLAQGDDRGRGYVLHVGAIDGRKQLAPVAEACGRLGLPLVAVGPRLVDEPIPDGCRHLGYVSEEILAALYAGASCVAYLSSGEGFGLPIVEALGCGTPVLASPTGAVPEIGSVAGGWLGVTGASGEAEQRADLLASMLEHQIAMGRSAQVAAAVHARFNWAATAAGTADVYRSLL